MQDRGIAAGLLCHPHIAIEADRDERLTRNARASCSGIPLEVTVGIGIMMTRRMLVVMQPISSVVAIVVDVTAIQMRDEHKALLPTTAVIDRNVCGSHEKRNHHTQAQNAHSSQRLDEPISACQADIQRHVYGPSSLPWQPILACR